jgi:uncharacterized protein (DUF983 family)
MAQRMSLWTILGRTLRLRCPTCGQGRLFSSWIRMPRQCSVCGLKYEREPGYFLGSIYFNYGVTALIVTIAYLSLFALTDVDPDVLLWSMVAFCVLFPLWFFRYARALWIAWDHFADPPATTAAVATSSDMDASDVAAGTTPARSASKGSS